ncbi:uncharacterized protein LOC107494185 isoform X3 [Arachis duranensis]|uniref:Uncharacterized protein LOC107494185 isoform X3 n=1 Tax=Arachis duranensis TaxID=130453 RepID=A0A6P5M5V3_ARADU|nr:uncharacterized protein LOC107494185 isoform X3 [Arachis duranensis]
MALQPSVKTSRSSSSPATSQETYLNGLSWNRFSFGGHCYSWISITMVEYQQNQMNLKLTLYQAGILLSTCQRKSRQDQFIVIVSQFLYIPWSYAQKQAGIRESMLNGDSCTPSINIGAAKALESEMIEYIKEQISSFFTDNLLRILRYIVLHMKRASKSEDDPSTSSGLPQIVGDQHRGDAS